MTKSDTNLARDLKLLRKYLLGQLDPATRDQVEDRLFPAGDPTPEDALFAERLEATEDELIDEYALGRLDHDARLQFALHFTWTKARREKLLDLSAYVRRAEQEPTAEAVTPPSTEAVNASPGEPAGQPVLAPERDRPQVGFWRLPSLLPSPALAAAASVLLLAAAFVGYQLGSSQSVMEPFPLVREAGGSTVLRVPAGTGLAPVVLDVGLPYRSYTAKLHRLIDADYVVVRSYELLRGTDTKGTTMITVPIDGEALVPGVYYIEVSGVKADGTVEFVSRHDFVVEP